MKRRSGSNTPIMLALLAVVVFSLGYYLSIQKEGLGGGPGPFKPRPKKTYYFYGTRKNYDSFEEYNVVRRQFIDQQNKQRDENIANLERKVPTKSSSTQDIVSWISDYLKNNNLFGWK